MKVNKTSIDDSIKRIKAAVRVLCLACITIFSGISFLLYKSPGKEYGDVSMADVSTVTINSVFMVIPGMITLAGDLSVRMNYGLTYLVEGPSCGYQPPVLEFCELETQWMSGSKGYIEDDWASYKAQPGYTILNNKKAVCTNKGEWIHIPKCVPLSCGRHPPFAENCEVKQLSQAVISEFVFNDLVIFNGQKGYRVVGNGVATCNENGEWENIPHCEQITCGNEPPQIQNCKVIDQQNNGNDGNFLPQDLITYTAINENYKVIGNEKMFCNDDGQFSSGPKCSPKEVCKINVPTVSFDNSYIETAECPHLTLLEGTTIHCPCNEKFHGHGLKFSCSGGAGGNPNKDGDCARSCFHGKNLVFEMNTQKRKYLKEVNIGDKVQGIDKKTGKIVNTKVTYVESKPEEFSTFHTIELKTSHILHGLTKDHYVNVFDIKSDRIHEVTAKEVKIGQTVMVAYDNQLGHPGLSEVLSVKTFDDQGVYVIETEHGNLFIDGINISTKSKDIS